MSVKPCPFCGGVIVKTNYKYPSGTVAVFCETCGAGFVRAGENALDDAHTAWNTRAERTCENASDSGFLCSACSFGDFDGFHGYKPNYCPNCGAKVVSE